jgi:hypothetical protein
LEKKMADQKSLGFIGLGLGAVTAAVMLVAVLVVGQAARNITEEAPPAMVRASMAAG